MADFKQRQTACKVKIGDLLKGEYFTREGFEPNYVNVNGKEVSRVNIIATIVNDYVNEEGSYATMTIDDGSGDIQLKTWNEDVQILSNAKLGELVLIIGKPKVYNNQIYLVPEIVRKIDNSSWIKVRQLELGKEESVKQEVVETKEEQPIVEEIVVQESSQNSRQKLLNSIEKFDSKEGAEISEVINDSGITEKEAQSIINELLKEGEVYQIKPGKLKLLE